MTASRRVRAHAAGALMVYESYFDLSPYFLSFGALPAGRTFPDIPFKNYRMCDTIGWSCRFDAKVVGVEKVTTPAGTFEATKVIAEFTGGSGQRPLWRTLTFWYSDSAKRMVKATVRTAKGFVLDADYDLELVSYKLN